MSTDSLNPKHVPPASFALGGKIRNPNNVQEKTKIKSKKVEPKVKSKN
jgi:hypothetical protein